MNLVGVLIGKIAIHECLACGAEGSLLCSVCLAALPALPEHCYRCQAATPASVTCNVCRPASSLNSVRAATVYGYTAKKLIWKLKYAGAQAAAEIMASRMTPLLARGGRTVLVSVPTTASRARQRGYDQSRLLARQLAKQTQLPWMDCLVRRDRAHQVGANREQRRQQLAGAFRVTQQRFVRDAHIILIDDVVTTGTTLETAAAVLKQAGAATIDALTFAQTPPGCK
jgi:ComF family protein